MKHWFYYLNLSVPHIERASVIIGPLITWELKHQEIVEHYKNTHYYHFSIMCDNKQIFQAF